MDIDDRGMFRIGKLAPGKYYVMAQPRGEYRTTFYPGVMDASAATPVQVNSGQEVTEIEIKLQSAPTYRISGKVRGVDLPGPETASQGDRLVLGIQRKSALFDEGLNASQQIQPDGTFELRDVPSGMYRIRVGSWSRNRMEYAPLGETEVQVNGHDVSGLSIDLVAPRALKVSLEVDGEHPDLSRLALSLTSDGFAENATFTDGEFVFPNLALDSYEVHVQATRAARYFVKSVRIGSVETAGPTLDLHSVGDAPVTVVLSRKGAEITATIRSDSPDPANTTVTLIPDSPDPRARDRAIQEATADQNGAFLIGNISPGEYRLFASKDGTDAPWSDPGFWNAIKDKGVPVKLAESDRKTIEAPVITPGMTP